MWKEIITKDDIADMAMFKQQFGCGANYTATLMESIIESVPDCHFYYYKSDNIQLLTGYRSKFNTVINSIAFSIKAEIEDYPEALRLMGEHIKSYLSNRDIKMWVVYFGTEDYEQMDTHNLGIGKLGYEKCIKLLGEAFTDIGMELIIDNKKITCRFL